MTSERMRLNKFLSRAGVASRREADDLIRAGRVRVDGKVAELGTSVKAEARGVTVDGKPVRLERLRWILLNKPRGAITTRKDTRGRKTVYALLDPRDRTLPYVGRLDRNTQGLLLFSNDGDLVHRLLHPSSEISREYRALVERPPSDEAIERMEEGVELEDGVARAEGIRLRKDPQGRGTVVSLVLREGRKHEVRRLLEAVGHPVLRLKRVAFGPIRLGDLRSGRWRELTPEEVGSLREAAGTGSRRGGPRGRPGR